MTTTRRFFLQSSAALAGTAALAGNAQAAALPFRYAYSATSWDTNVEEAVRVGERLGFPGIEPFRSNTINYLDKPLVLKKFMDDHHIQMATCSNGGGGNFSGNFYDPAKVDQSVKDHINFARTFIAPFGYCKHFKGGGDVDKPGLCEIVEGEIKPTAWCDRFDKARK
jgi:hypothetical protein